MVKGRARCQPEESQTHGVDLLGRAVVPVVSESPVAPGVNMRGILGVVWTPSAGAGLCPSFAFPATHLLSLTGSVSLGSLSGSVSLDSYSGVCQSPFLDNRYFKELEGPLLRGIELQGVVGPPLLSQPVTLLST